MGQIHIKKIIAEALREDAVKNDITTTALIPKKQISRAYIIFKEDGVVCGLEIARAVFRTIDKNIQFSARFKDGARVKKNTKIAFLKGKTRALLAGERVALNFLGHLSGVATLTNDFVKKMAPLKTPLLDTRKTTPLLRELERYAVRCGGGKNHRMSLKTSVLIKDNHLRICRLIKKDWMGAIKNLRRKHPSLPVEMEIQTSQDLHDAFRLSPHQVLLDNMRPTKLRTFVKRLRPRLPGVEIEISGGVRTEQLRGLRRLGVERISMGRLTHSAPAFDCALDITRVFYPR